MTQAVAAVEVPPLQERALLDGVACSQSEPHGPLLQQRETDAQRTEETRR
jgi:hypothetical protein